MLYIALALCALAAAALVYRYDLYDREPWPLLGVAAGLGALGMALAGVVERAAFAALPALAAGAAAPALTAAVLEELVKLGSVLLVARVARARFNDAMDGLIYGSLAGVGMALEESLAWLRLAQAGAGVLPGAEVVRLVGQLVMGGLAPAPSG